MANRILLVALICCLPLAARADNTNFLPGDACTAPISPVGNSDPGAISNYQAARSRFMDCVQHEDPSSPTYQRDLDQSLAAIGNDQLQQTDIIQQENRGALDRLGLGDRK